VLAGTYSSNVTVEGACLVNSGPAVIEGNLTAAPGAVLLAAFAEHGSKLTVAGNLQVEYGATLILGCEPSSAYTCLDNPAGSSGASVSGQLWARYPLGVVVHDSVVSGNVTEIGGGGGFTCENKGPTVGGFPVFGAAFGGLPVFSTYEDATVGGNLIVTGLTSCWLGVARAHVGGSVALIYNRLADPDAIEVVANDISRDLYCGQNSQVWDSAEAVPGGPTFPRVPDPNMVGGRRLGQCVHEGPIIEGGPPGSGPF